MLRRRGDVPPERLTPWPTETTGDAAAGRSHRLTATLREEARVTPLELFFDLVFVLALTQCTALMAADPTWEGLAKGLLVLGVMWWSWVGYAWLTSVVNPEEGSVRLVMFAAMAAFLVVALARPGAFERRGAAVRGRLRDRPLRADRPLPDRRAATSPELRRNVWGLLVSTTVGCRPAVRRRVRRRRAAGRAVGARDRARHGAGRCSSTPTGWRLQPAHFAERHGLIVIIALGESIVAIGVGAGHDVDDRRRRRGVPRDRGRRRRCGGRTSTSSRSSPSGGSRTPADASATRSRATPSPTCTCRWSPGSCSPRSG